MQVKQVRIGRKSYRLTRKTLCETSQFLGSCNYAMGKGSVTIELGIVSDTAEEKVSLRLCLDETDARALVAKLNEKLARIDTMRQMEKRQ